MVIVEIVVVCVLIILAQMFYTLVIKPKKELQNYARMFEKQGFKVYKYPYKFMQSPGVEFWQQKQKGNDVLAVMKDQYYKYDVVLSNFVHNVMIEFINPSLLKEFYSTEGVDLYYKMKNINNPMKRVLGKGLLTSQGIQWKKKRSLMSKVFNFQLVKSQTSKIASICDYSINRIQNLKTTTTPEEGWKQFQIFQLTASIFSNVVIESFVGGNVRDLQFDSKPCYRFVASLIIENSNRIFQTLTSIFGVKYLNLGIWESHRQTNRKIALYRNWCKKFIHEQIQKIKEELKGLTESDKKTKQPKTVVQALLYSNIDFKEQDVMEEFMVFFIAGTDTTALMLQAMVYQTARNPQIEKIVREEVSQFMKDDDYSYENLKNLKYVECIQKEAIRMYGPVVNVTFREAEKDHYLKGVPIKKGTIINPSIYSNHFNPKYYTNPKVFNPSRWETQCIDLPPYTYGGFGLGPRSCIGKQLAFLQCKIAFIKILKRYSQVVLPKNNYKLVHTCFYEPEHFTTRFKISQ